MIDDFVHASLFSGIGGFDLAAQQSGWQNLFHCEIEPFCQKILQYHFPNSIPHHDITKTDFTIYRNRVDCLTGGFPCQGNSVAGLRLGTDDHRYLWPEYLRAIDEIQPTWVCGENVTGILSMEDKSGIYHDVFAKVENRKITNVYPIDNYEAIYTRQSKMLICSICEDLEKRGYEVQTFAIPAAGIEAPHKRERIWIVAYNAAYAGCVAGYRRESEQRNGINNWSNSGRPETANQSKRSYQAWPGTETQSEWRNLAGLFTSPGNSFPANPNSDDAIGHGYGQTGQTPHHIKIIKKERQRLRSVIERISGEESVTNAASIIKRKPTNQINTIAKSWDTWAKFGGNSDKRITSIPTSNGIRKGIIKRSSELLNQNGKEKPVNADARRSGREEFNSPDFAAKSGEFGGGGDARFTSAGNWDNFPTQSPVCSGDDGISGRLDGITFSKWRNESIKGFGNAIVPQVVLQIFSAINKYRIFETSPK